VPGFARKFGARNGLETRCDRAATSPEGDACRGAEIWAWFKAGQHPAPNHAVDPGGGGGLSPPVGRCAPLRSRAAREPPGPALRLDQPTAGARAFRAWPLALRSRPPFGPALASRPLRGIAATEEGAAMLAPGLRRSPLVAAQPQRPHGYPASRRAASPLVARDAPLRLAPSDRSGTRTRGRPLRALRSRATRSFGLALRARFRSPDRLPFEPRRNP